MGEAPFRPPEPPPPGAEASLPPALDARVKRVRWLLILVPFTFGSWFRLRRESGVASGRLVLELWLNLLQSVLVLVLLALAAGLLVFREQIVAGLAGWIVDAGILR